MTKVVLILLFSLVSLPVLAIQVDLASVAECDQLYKPEGCTRPGDSLALKGGLRGDSGLVLSEPTGSMPIFRRAVVNLSATRAVEERVDERPRNTEELEESLDQTTPTSPNEFGASSIPQHGPNGTTQPGAPGQALQPVTQVGGNGPEVRGGMIFANDDGASKKIQPIQASTTNRNDLAQNRGVNPVSLNQNNDGSDENNSGTGGAFSGFSGSNNSPSLSKNGESGTVKKTKPRGDSYLDRLAKYAKGLGRRFFGATGSGLLGNGKGNPLYVGKNGKRGQTKLASGGNNLDGLDLKGAYNGSRSPAGFLEFSGPNGWIFGNICEHWKDLAHQDQLGKNDHPCAK